MNELFWILGVCLISSVLVAFGILGRRRPVAREDLRELAVSIRGAARPLPEMGDGIAWKVASKQVEFEGEFLAFALAYTHHEPPVTNGKDAYRRGVATALVWHGIDPDNVPNAGLHDILHKQSLRETESGDGS
jgi:hypothetical protein